MPYVWIPSSTLGSNQPTSSFAHPTHGTLGVLAKGTDPRSRGRRRSRAEIEASSRAARAAREEHLSKLRSGVEARKAAAAEAAAATRSNRAADLAAAAKAAGVPGSRMLWQAPATPKAGPEPTSPSSLLGPGRAARIQSGAAISDILDQPIVTPHTARAATNLFRHEPVSVPGPAPSQTYRAPKKQSFAEFAMNPSGRETPSPTSLSGPIGMIEDELALRSMLPSERESVESQRRSLQYSALPYTVPTGLAGWYGSNLSGLFGQ